MAIKYKWLVHCLEDLIQTYKKKGIVKLPSESELCHKYNVSRQTVRLALSILETCLLHDYAAKNKTKHHRKQSKKTMGKTR